MSESLFKVDQIQLIHNCFLLRLDVAPVITETLFAYNNIDSWVKPEKAKFDINVFPLSPKIHKEPKGVALIISPFNYPLWCLGPIVSIQ